MSDMSYRLESEREARRTALGESQDDVASLQMAITALQSERELLSVRESLYSVTSDLKTSATQTLAQDPSTPVAMDTTVPVDHGNVVVEESLDTHRLATDQPQRFSHHLKLPKPLFPLRIPELAADSRSCAVPIGPPPKIVVIAKTQASASAADIHDPEPSCCSCFFLSVRARRSWQWSEPEPSGNGHPVLTPSFTAATGTHASETKLSGVDVERGERNLGRLRSPFVGMTSITRGARREGPGKLIVRGGSARAESTTTDVTHGGPIQIAVSPTKRYLGAFSIHA